MTAKESEDIEVMCEVGSPYTSISLVRVNTDGTEEVLSVFHNNGSDVTLSSAVTTSRRQSEDGGSEMMVSSFTNITCDRQGQYECRDVSGQSVSSFVTVDSESVVIATVYMFYRL